MANAFFNDTLSPFEGIDIGWGQDPNFPIGEYAVVQDAAGAANKQFTLFQTEDDEIALSEGVLMITGPATSGFDQDSFDEDKFSGRASWHQIGREFAKLDDDDNPLLARDIDGKELSIQNGEDYGFWIALQSQDMFPDKASPHASVGRLLIEQINDTIRFIGSNTYKADTDAVNLVDELGQGNQFTYPVIFLGSAKIEVIDGKTTATFTQYTFGPLTLPTISYLDDLVSEDRTSRLTVGGDDRGIKTSSIAAGDSTTNDIYENADGQVQLRIGVVSTGEPPVSDIEIVREEEDGITVPKLKVRDGAFADPADDPDNVDHTH